MIDRKRLPIRDRSLSHKARVKPLGCEASADSIIASQHPERPMFSSNLMEVICERSNLQRALKRVCQNKGAPGIDGMTVDDLKEYLRTTWPALKVPLLQGRYRPQPLRRIEIPKPSGKGSRKRDVSRFIASKRERDRRRSYHARPCSYVDIHSSKTQSIRGCWFHQRQKRYTNCASIYEKREEFHGVSFLGSRLFCNNGWA